MKGVAWRDERALHTIDDVREKMYYPRDVAFLCELPLVFSLGEAGAFSGAVSDVYCEENRTAAANWGA